MSKLKVDRKAIKVGNSLGVTLPKEALSQMNISQGDTVDLSVKEGAIHVSKSRSTELPEDVSPEFVQALNRTMDKYDSALRDLADR